MIFILVLTISKRYFPMCHLWNPKDPSYARDKVSKEPVRPEILWQINTPINN